MHTPALACVAAVVLAAGPLVSQAVSTTGIERDLQQDRSWRLSYDNDFFAATDLYFTQGLVLEVVSPALRRLPVMPLLFRPRGSTNRFGVAFEDDGYTPSDLKASQILVGDHPYAGTKQLRAFVLSYDPTRQRRFTSSLNVGIIGQGAGGKEIQTWIHRKTGNTIPQGWQHQIRNDVILNYEASVEEPIWRRGSRMLLTRSATARLGTLNTAVSAGVTLLAGRLGEQQVNSSGAARTAWYAYAKPQVNLVGYDATLQGGLFNRSSPYVIAARDLSRLVVRQQIGIVLRTPVVYVEYYRTFATREFRGALAHGSGGVLIGRALGR